jgi:hypothetical protein
MNTNALTTKLKALLQTLQEHVAIVVIVAFAAIYGTILFKINSLTSHEPTDKAVSDQLKTVRRPRIDQQAVNTMTHLEDQNVKTQTIFNEARQNPFTE